MFDNLFVAISVFCWMPHRNKRAFGMRMSYLKPCCLKGSPPDSKSAEKR